MAVEVTSIHEPRRLLQRRPARRSGERLRQDLTRARRRRKLLQLLFIIPLVALSATALAFLWLYTSYSKIVDERLASGYLTSRAGIYAAPRVLRTGQHFSRQRLTEALRRAAYVEGAASDVWNGRFAVEDESILISPRRTAGSALSTLYREVRVDFDRRGRISSIVGDGATLDSYTLEPEALSNDASLKTGGRAALASRRRAVGPRSHRPLQGSG
jgi:hypothetical protein